MALLNQYAAAGLDHQAGSTGGYSAAHGSSQLTELLAGQAVAASSRPHS